MKQNYTKQLANSFSRSDHVDDFYHNLGYMCRHLASCLFQDAKSYIYFIYGNLAHLFVRIFPKRTYYGFTSRARRVIYSFLYVFPIRLSTTATSKPLVPLKNKIIVSHGFLPLTVQGMVSGYLAETAAAAHPREHAQTLPSRNLFNTIKLENADDGCLKLMPLNHGDTPVIGLWDVLDRCCNSYGWTRKIRQRHLNVLLMAGRSCAVGTSVDFHDFIDTNAHLSFYHIQHAQKFFTHGRITPLAFDNLQDFGKIFRLMDWVVYLHTDHDDVGEDLYTAAMMARYNGKAFVLVKETGAYMLNGFDIESRALQFRKRCDAAEFFGHVLEHAVMPCRGTEYDYRLPRLFVTPSQVVAAQLNLQRPVAFTSIIVLIHNNKDIIGRLIESLESNLATWQNQYEIIVVDNASKDGGAAFVRTHYPRVKLLVNSENGCASGRNLGYKSAKGEFIVFFDSDQIVLSDAPFREAHAILSQNPQIGAVGWVGGWFDTRLPTLACVSTIDLPRYGINKEYKEKGYRTDVGYLGTGGLFTTRAVLEKTKLFDTFLDPTCFEDTDLTLQIRQQGLALAYRHFPDILHDEHQTTRPEEDRRRYMNLFLRNANYVRRKFSNNSKLFWQKPKDEDDLRLSDL